ncbi:MAG TPA: HEAT repeat domain-containing protein [Polyangia bacterium]|nr:HEAT repeat domain-containing protein [Polyangia bacterium]
MRTQRPSNALPRFTVAAVLACLLLAAGQLAAQAPPPGAPGAEDKVDIPDSRSWTVEQAVVNLRASDKGLRLAALNRLAREPGANIQKWIAEAARYDPEPRIRYEAVQILGKRKETESLPTLIFIGEKDTDDRVRTAARSIAQAAGVPVAGTPAPAGQPAPAAPPPKAYDAQGNELPPGYLDGQGTAGPGAAAEFDSPLSRPMVDMEYVDEDAEKVAHQGFIAALGFDGAIGSPRNTLARNRVGLQLGLASSGTVNTSASGSLAGDEIIGINDFTATDFSLLIDGTWAPWDFLEMGLALEVLTAEKLEHVQDWSWATGSAEGESIDTDVPDIYNDASYGGAALGFLSLDLKALLHRSELFRLGLVARVTFPTHTGERFESGIGAPVLFLPTSSTSARRENRTADGRLWGIEPGVVASVVPTPHLSLYADLSFAMTILSYTHLSRDISAGVITDNSNDLSAFNVFLIPNLGAQYRFLDETLGVQLALQPTIYLGNVVGSSLASFGIAPGISYLLLEHLELTLTASIETTGDAPRSFLCTDLQTSDKDQPQPCGVGRRFGMALKTSWIF